MEILKVHNLSKVYGKGDTQIKAIDDVSFNVETCVIVADSTGPDFARLVKKHNGRRRQL